MAGGSSDDVRAHIEWISKRTHGDVQRLTEALNRREWPGGGDQTSPGAVAWLQRWRPSGPMPHTPLCSCAEGRCLVCN